MRGGNAILRSRCFLMLMAAPGCRLRRVLVNSSRGRSVRRGRRSQRSTHEGVELEQ